MSASASVENLVVGTGYGGAVAAERLAALGKKVTMLEMGARWNTPGADGHRFSTVRRPDQRSMWFRDRTRMPLSRLLGIPIDRKIRRGPGVLDYRDFGEMGVYLGRGVGGGSLVNGGMAPRPRRDMVERQLPAVDVDEFFSVYLPRAEERLGVASIPHGFRERSPYYRFTRTGRRDAERAGYRVIDVPNVYDFDHMQREAAGTAPRSALRGQVIFGNDHGKRDLTTTYLARAEGTGNVSIETMTEATQISPAPAGGYDVATLVRTIDGEQRDGPTFRARRLFLGAGSVGTTELLLRSTASNFLTEVGDELGDHWGPNGNTMFARLNYPWRRTGARHSTIPVMGIDRWDSDHPSFTEIAPMPIGIEPFIQLYLAIADNHHRGRFSLLNGELTLDWTRKMSRTSIENARATFDRINQQQRTVYLRSLFEGRKAFSDDMTYHPLGGAVLGRVTDHVGRVRGQEQLYVTDGALIPQMIGVNPFLTITALAERLMDHVIEHDLSTN